MVFEFRNQGNGNLWDSVKGNVYLKYFRVDNKNIVFLFLFLKFDFKRLCYIDFPRCVQYLTFSTSSFQ